MRKLITPVVALVTLVLGVLGLTLVVATPSSANTVGRTRLTVEDPVVIRDESGARADYLVRVEGLRRGQCITFTRFTLRDPSGDRFYLENFRNRQCANRNGVVRLGGWFVMSAVQEDGRWLAKVVWKGNTEVVRSSYDYFEVINRVN